jgi:hypothetical protein
MRSSRFDFDVITDGGDRRDRKPWTPLLHLSEPGAPVSDRGSASPTPTTKQPEQTRSDIHEVRKTP